MSWCNEVLNDNEDIYKQKMDVYLSKLARVGSKEEWMDIIKNNIPSEFRDRALEYVLERQSEMNLPTSSIYNYPNNVSKLKK